MYSLKSVTLEKVIGGKGTNKAKTTKIFNLNEVEEQNSLKIQAIVRCTCVIMELVGYYLKRNVRYFQVRLQKKAISWEIVPWLECTPL